MSELKKRITDDIKAAMKGSDKTRLGTLRMISAAIKQREVDERIELSDEQILTVLDKMSKQRRESIAQYDAAGRDDLSAVEKNELAIIQEFLPAQLTDEEIDALIKDALAATGAADIKDMGKVMGFVKPKAQGRADMSQISARIRAQLGAG
ncbi:GatB/YqeY domain-containing protein [Granulosicoccaceae sp. 1_MG-2023]|nr:GatB/YqeY domain-containing protein [Granulosicoccaceae sp. 1_MG-2023]